MIDVVAPACLVELVKKEWDKERRCFDHPIETASLSVPSGECLPALFRDQQWSKNMTLSNQSGAFKASWLTGFYPSERRKKGKKGKVDKQRDGMHPF